MVLSILLFSLMAKLCGKFGRTPFAANFKYMLWCINAYKFLMLLFVMAEGAKVERLEQNDSSNGEFCVGFKDGVLEAKYVCGAFSFSTTIPLVERTRRVALSDLAEKIVEHGIPYQKDQEIPVPAGLGYEALSESDRDLLFNYAFCVSLSNKE